jgi:VanZ family protein
VGYVVLGGLFLRAWTREERPGWRAALQVWALSFLWGAYLEIVQALTPLRRADWRDALVNGIGAALGMLAWIVFAACWRRWARPPLAPPPVDSWEI